MLTGPVLTGAALGGAVFREAALTTAVLVEIAFMPEDAVSVGAVFMVATGTLWMGTLIGGAALVKPVC